MNDENAPGVFPSYSYEQLAQMQKDDEALGVLWGCWTSGWSPGEEVDLLTPEVKGWLKEFHKLVEKNGVLYRSIQGHVRSEPNQLLVPCKLRPMLLSLAHDDWGHQGINRTQDILKSRCFWPGLHKDTKKYIQDCFTCTTIKAPTPKVRMPRRYLLAFKPMELVATDFLKLDRGKGGIEDVLVMTDSFTKYAQAIPCRNQTAPVVARALRDHWFCHYGAPLRIHSDQGRNFESSLIKELCKLYGIKKSHTTPYHPEGNGQTERFNRTLCGMIRSLDPSLRRNWPELVGYLVFLYNATPHRVTKMSPFYLLFGREPHTPLDQLLTNTRTNWNEDFVEAQSRALEEAHRVVQDRMRNALESEKERYDQKPMSSPFPVGTKVLLKTCHFEGRHKLTDKYGRDALVVVWVNEEGDVYGVRPALGGPIQVVNRTMLVKDRRSYDVLACDIPPGNTEEPDDDGPIPDKYADEVSKEKKWIMNRDFYHSGSSIREVVRDPHQLYQT